MLHFKFFHRVKPRAPRRTRKKTEKPSRYLSIYKPPIRELEILFLHSELYQQKKQKSIPSCRISNSSIEWSRERRAGPEKKNWKTVALFIDLLFKGANCDGAALFGLSAGRRRGPSRRETTGAAQLCGRGDDFRVAPASRRVLIKS